MFFKEYSRDLAVDDILSDLLRAIRLHLGMDIAFVSEFSDNRRIFRYVDCACEKPVIQVGDSDPLHQTYCQRIVDGRLPQIIQDAALIPAAAELPVTRSLPVGAHISIPIQLTNGRIYGTFCCLSSAPDCTLAERELAVMQVFAEFIGEQIERELADSQSHNAVLERIHSVLESEALSIVYQPIYHLKTEKIVGFEALTRFSILPYRTPDVWFAEAAHVGLGEQLEIKALEKALQELKNLPPEIYLSLNVAPASILSGAVTQVLQGRELSRIVLEVTEHVSVVDYKHFSTVLSPLRKQGLRLAIDDAGAGYASFRHILKLEPDLIKLDMSLTRDIDTDYARRALATALIQFSEVTGSQIIAEGVETQSELSTLRHLRIDKAQGYLIGRPLPITSATTLLQVA